MHLSIFATVMAAILPVAATQPNRQPAIASTSGLTALVFGSGNSIWISISKDDAKHFSAPHEVAHAPALALGRHRGPRVAISGSTLVVTAIYGATPDDPLKGDLVAWRSRDGGQSWTGPVVVNDVPGAAREGLHAAAATPGGTLAAVWLDLRRPGTRIVGAYSKDSGQSWSRNVLLYERLGGTVCQCCAPSISFGQDGSASVMFRNVVGETRDLYILHWDPRKQPTEPRKVGTGSWALNACPMDGGGLAQRGNDIGTAWRRDKTVYLTEGSNEETAVGEGKDVAIAFGTSGAYAAWTGADGIEVHEPGQKAPRSLSPSGAFPAMAALSNGSVLVAWEDNGEIETKTVR
jgi:hypothetical protein